MIVDGALDEMLSVKCSLSTYIQRQTKNLTLFYRIQPEIVDEFYGFTHIHRNTLKMRETWKLSVFGAYIPYQQSRLKASERTNGRVSERNRGMSVRTWMETLCQMHRNLIPYIHNERICMPTQHNANMLTNSMQYNIYTFPLNTILQSTRNRSIFHRNKNKTYGIYWNKQRWTENVFFIHICIDLMTNWFGWMDGKWTEVEKEIKRNWFVLTGCFQCLSILPDDIHSFWYFILFLATQCTSDGCFILF